MTQEKERSPHIYVKRIAWDGWDAVVGNCPLIRSRKGSAIEAVEDVLAQLAVLAASEIVTGIKP